MVVGEFVRKELPTGEIVIEKTEDAMLDELADLYRKRAATLKRIDDFEHVPQLAAAMSVLRASLL